MWTPSESLGPEASTFFSIMNLGLHLYFPLPGLCWDIVNCNDPEIQDDPRLEDQYNVEDVVTRAVAAAKSLGAAYRGNDMYFTLGFDFNYEYAEEWFGNTDKMIYYVNQNTSQHGVNMFYSSPAQVVAAKRATNTTSWPTKTPEQGDGFPCACACSSPCSTPAPPSPRSHTHRTFFGTPPNPENRR